MFSARGYNIESLTVAPTEDPTLSRMTLVTSGSDEIIEQITKQLNKLIDVVKLIDISESSHIERELMMVKTRATNGMREEIKRLAEIFRGNIIDVTPTTYVIEVTGEKSKLDAFLAGRRRRVHHRSGAFGHHRHRARRKGIRHLNERVAALTGCRLPIHS